jgi:hypothetical protein
MLRLQVTRCGLGQSALRGKIEDENEDEDEED